MLQLLPLIVVIAVAIYYVDEHAADEAQINKEHAAQEAQTNYENLIVGCERNNPVREAVVLATRTAARNATEGQAFYRQATLKILDRPHVESSGAVDCRAAIQEPK